MRLADRPPTRPESLTPAPLVSGAPKPRARSESPQIGIRAAGVRETAQNWEFPASRLSVLSPFSENEETGSERERNTVRC